jgi:ribose transport system permease protein
MPHIPQAPPHDRLAVAPQAAVHEHSAPTARSGDEAAPESDRRRPERTGRLLRSAGARYGVVVVWLLEIVVFAVLEPDTFFSWASATSILSSQASLLVLALALVPTLAAGEIDLSAASTMTIAATVVGQLNGVMGLGVFPAVAAGLAVALVVGLVNGWLTVYLGIQGIIVTLGMGTLLVGLSVWISGSVTIGGVSPSLGVFFNSALGGVNAAFFYALLVAALLWYGYRHTPIGRELVFVGQNREVARLSGVPVARVRMIAFATTSFLSGVAGVMVVGIAGGLQPTSLGTLLLPAFAAAFLGSAIIEPGRVNPLGTVIALLFLATGISGLVLLGLDSWIRDVFYGTAVIVAVGVSRLGVLRAQRRA